MKDCEHDCDHHQHVQIDVDESSGVAVVTLNRPRKGNSITGAMVDTLHSFFRNVNQVHRCHHHDAQRDARLSHVRVIVLTGAGKYFCTGMDLSAGNQEALQCNPKSVATSFIALCEELRTCAVPVVCRVNGPVIGGGIVLLFLSTVRLASRTAFLSFAEVRQGLIPAMISAYIVPVLGVMHSKDLMITGRRLDAEGMKTLGVATEVCNPGTDLDAQTQYYVDLLLSNASGAMTAQMDLIEFVATHAHSESLERAQQCFRTQIRSAEFQYGVQQFRQKRTPNWTAFHSKL